MDENKPRALRMFLVKLARELTPSQVSQLKEIWAEVVPVGIISDTKNAFELFPKLQQNHHLSPELLKKTFKAIGRQDLAEDVEKNEDLFPKESKGVNSSTFEGAARPAGLYNCYKGWHNIHPGHTVLY